MAKKCPLCQGKVEQGYCVSCGYKVPDESEIEDLTSRYSLNPEEEQPSFRQFKDASVRVAPDIKVARDTRPQPYVAPQTPHTNFGQTPSNNTGSQWNNTHPQQTNNTGWQSGSAAQTPNRYANTQNSGMATQHQSGWQNGTGVQNMNNAAQGVPYSGAGSRNNNGWQSGTGIQNQTNYNNTNGNNVPFEPYQQNVYNNNGVEKGFIAQRWWMILVALIAPIVGFIFAATLKTYTDPEAKKLQKILIIVSVVRLLFGIFIS